MAIRFFNEQTTFQLKGKQETKKWVKQVIDGQHKKVGEINIIFCSDSYLHEINVDYLNHDTYTDIITFDNSDDETVIESDIYISIDRVTENAAKEGVSMNEELHRVIIHGVLHLLGYSDKTDTQKQQMRLKENACLSLLFK